ncbi:MAG: hypothetical protein HOL98_16925 [Gammaproteobacteria bacterium]|nr:hypothetical protein [Gammaproteobacteria bacterium]MBT5205145.1 hypothetical protein [Gammaproteobacteria bacterium]MBT5602587.1 hypothetical protein [Gammaproteobacteria bacterium]MBT6244188.1 hypothetical protein [Gammaproteobacteria bacterium]
MEFLLKPFEPCYWIDHFSVELALEQPDQLRFQVTLRGDQAFLNQLPQAQTGRRVYALWEQTCFELFIGKANCKHYLEWNLAATGDWNCFSFEDERIGMQTSNLLKLLGVSSNSNSRGFCINSQIRLAKEVANQWLGTIGAAAVIKHANETAYFALAHGPNPDFHDRRYHQPIELT